jgi:hypothetical protein
MHLQVNLDSSCYDLESAISRSMVITKARASMQIGYLLRMVFNCLPNLPNLFMQKFTFVTQKY